MVVTVIAGALNGVAPLRAAAQLVGRAREADLAIWSIALADGATWTVPAAQGDAHGADAARVLGSRAARGRDHGAVPGRHPVHANQDVEIQAVDGPVEILLLQGRPIGEPVAQYGPFVMNTRSRSWSRRSPTTGARSSAAGRSPRHAPVHPRAQGRFARHADGRVEHAPA